MRGLNLIVLLLLGVSCISSETQNGVKNINSPAKEYPAFGRAMRSEFLLDPEFIQLNHGAYGTYPKEVRDGLRQFADRAEANVELWMRREGRQELDNVRSQLAKLINAPSKDIVMIPNATSGMNAIFRSMVFAAGERILHFSTIYSSMGRLMNYMEDYFGVQSLIFDAKFPMSNDQLMSELESFLEVNFDSARPIRITLIDHITSMPAVVQPIDRIIPLLKSYNITVLIDGAHAIGQIPIDLEALKPDYYITNCHKWLYAARGAAIMYVAPEHQASIHPAHIAVHYNNPSRFHDEFFWTGTIDYSPYMTVNAALEFRRRIGGEEVIREYTHNLALEGSALLALELGTQVLQDEDQTGNLADVRMPLDNPEDPQLSEDFFNNAFMDRFNIFTGTYYHNGAWWIRTSAQIYNDLRDYEIAAIVFRIICDELNAGVFSGTIHKFPLN